MKKPDDAAAQGGPQTEIAAALEQGALATHVEKGFEVCGGQGLPAGGDQDFHLFRGGVARDDVGLQGEKFLRTNTMRGSQHQVVKGPNQEFVIPQNSDRLRLRNNGADYDLGGLPGKIELETRGACNPADVDNLLAEMIRFFAPGFKAQSRVKRKP